MRSVTLTLLILALAAGAFSQRNLGNVDGLDRVIQSSSEIRSFGEGERKRSVANAGDRIGKALGIQKSAKGLYEAAAALSKGDCAPDFSVNAQAMVPSSCSEVLKGPAARNDTGSGEATECATCYENAYKKLNDVRKRLAKLKCLGNSTKNYVTAAFAFGDSVASVHAVQGLAWARERKAISESYTKFKAAYDLKYKELMGVLLEAMNDVSECEAKSGNPDWFQRYGFMYVEFMAERYKRVD